MRPAINFIPLVVRAGRTLVRTGIYYMCELTSSSLYSYRTEDA